MTEEGMSQGTMTLGGKEVPTRTGMIAVGGLRFYAENPRVYSAVSANEREPSQVDIFNALVGMEHVKILLQSIRANGLQNPLIVREGDFVVLEGNSRLAALRLLAQHDPIMWGNVKCTLLPSNIGEDLVFSLLGICHIIGQTPWKPYEQAGYLYRRCKQHNVEPARMAREMSLSLQTVRHLITVYEFMVQHKEGDISRWSYYDEYLKSPAIKKVREKNADLDEVVVEKIKSGEIEKAVDVRKKLVCIAKGGKKVVDGFLSGVSFQSSYESASLRGEDVDWRSRLRRFHSELAELRVDRLFRHMDESKRAECAHEMKMICRMLRDARRKMGYKDEDAT